MLPPMPGMTRTTWSISHCFWEILGGGASQYLHVYIDIPTSLKEGCCLNPKGWCFFPAPQTSSVQHPLEDPGIYIYITHLHPWHTLTFNGHIGHPGRGCGCVQGHGDVGCVQRSTPLGGSHFKAPVIGPAVGLPVSKPERSHRVY